MPTDKKKDAYVTFDNWDPTTHYLHPDDVTLLAKTVENEIMEAINVRGVDPKKLKCSFVSQNGGQQFQISTWEEL